MNFPGRRFKDGEVIYSEWFQRGGDNAIFRAEKVDHSGTTISVTFNLYTKNADDTGDGTVLLDSGASAYELKIDQSSGTTIQELVIDSEDASQGMEELLRVKATVSGGSADDWLLGRLFPPVFYDGAVPST